MTQLDQLRLMNNATILYLKKLNMSYERNSIISNILKDDSCFFKLSKQDAYTILEDIGVESQQIYLAYLDLISIDNYYSLKNSGKISRVLKLNIYDEQCLSAYFQYIFLFP